MLMVELNIAEILFDGGGVRLRYARYMSEDKSRWIRHGQFQAYHPNGNLASEGTYSHGRENGLWRDYHDNGQLAAEGRYEDGKEVGPWMFWNADGAAEHQTI